MVVEVVVGVLVMGMLLGRDYFELFSCSYGWVIVCFGWCEWSGLLMKEVRCCGGVECCCCWSGSGESWGGVFGVGVLMEFGVKVVRIWLCGCGCSLV